MQDGIPKSALSLSGSMKTTVIVVVLGVIGQQTMMQWTARTVLKHVTSTAQSLLTAAVIIQRADTALQSMTREYSRAVVSQKSASLESAGRDAAEVASRLDLAGKLMEIG
jgi:hypothetical protein